MSPDTGAKLDAYDLRIVPHCRFESVEQEVLARIEHPSDGRLIPLLGPTGAGKSAVALHLGKKITKDMHDELLHNPSRYPFIYTKMVRRARPDQARRGIFTGLLNAINEPLVNCKTDPDRVEITPAFGKNRKRPNDDELTDAAISLILKRKPRVIIVDEAQHLTDTRSAEATQIQFDTLKSIADAVQTPLLLIGPYALGKYLRQDGQLIRRSRPVHFSRYDWACPEDQTSFQRVLRSFSGYLSKDLGLTADLSSDPEGLFEVCLGCIGLLKATLFDAAKACLMQGITTVTWEMIESKAVPVVERAELFREISEGIAFFHDPAETRQSLREALGLAGAGSTKLFAEEPVVVERKTSRKVGKRNPVRDPVGVPMEMEI